MKTRLGTLTATLALAVIAVLGLATGSEAQVEICSANNVSTASGTTACADQVVTASAIVRASAKLTLQTVFNAAPAALEIPFGTVDAMCNNGAGPGITCVPDSANNEATWYGTVGFRVRLTGLGTTKAKLIGTRQPGGTFGASSVLDGAAGMPATPYMEGSPLELKTGLGNGTTDVTRQFGVKIGAADPAGALNASTVYSLVIE
jgi:hypothetical protein